MAQTPPAWVVPVMRAGYAARGAVYTVVGFLALKGAFDGGGGTEGTTGALARLRSEWWGIPALWLIAVGLAAYMVWRLIDAAYDLEDHGTDARGLVARTGQVVTGLIHGAIGASVAGLALGQSSGGDSAKDWTAKLMTLPYGASVIMAAGAITLGAGIFYIHKGISEKYKRTLRVTALTERLDPAMKAGFIAQGAVIAIIGALLIYAGLTANPDQAGGVGAALDWLRAQVYGRILLAITGAGLLAFALENLVESAYRVVPRCAGPDVQTLAMQAKAQARRAMS